MRRRLFTAVSALSLLLGLAIVALWVRSYWSFDFVTVLHGHTNIEADSEFGYVELDVTTWHATFEPSLQLQHLPLSDGKRDAPVFGVRFRTADVGLFDGYAFLVCDWVLVVVLLALPVWRTYLAYRLLRRRRHGLCLSCGYDLTGNPSGVCPECGTPTTQELPIKTN